MKLLLLAATLWLSQPANADTIDLDIPIVDDSPLQHVYFHELLAESLRLIGHEANLIAHRLPQKRIKNMLDTGKISIYWMLSSRERNLKYTAIPIDLTNGLIGKRILLIRKGDQHLFENVSSLEQFRKLDLRAGLADGWFDQKVWTTNKLPYSTHDGNWKSIFKMLAREREYDYFPRGAFEIQVEAEAHPNLEIEKHLLFIYDRDFRFYLSTTGNSPGSKHRDIITKALAKAKSTGLMAALIEKHFKGLATELNLATRVHLHLVTPE